MAIELNLETVHTPPRDAATVMVLRDAPGGPGVEVLMLRRILTTNRPAMLVLPFVSICSEKSEHLRCDVLVEDCCAILAD